MTEEPSAIEKVRLSGEGVESDLMPSRLGSKLDGILEPMSDWFSSILIKEARQAFRSRQFVWTYILQLILVAAWTAIGFSLFQRELGTSLLLGYFIILGFPLAVIIPFSGYRSLAREFDDGTISLISITTMKPRQIIFGKLGSALIQLVMYLSVLAPCISFTYLLQGISIWRILLGLLVSVGGSIFLTIFGLFLAGSFRSRNLGVGVSVVFSIALSFAYFFWIGFCFAMSESSFSRYGSEESLTVAGFVLFFGSTALLLLASVVAQISFPSDNRSTLIRVMLLIQQTLFFGWIGHLLCMESFMDGVPTVILLVVGHYWLGMGFLMCGESTNLSRRVRRSLPRSLPGRLFYSLFMPGAGRGFLFALANVWAAFLIVWFLAIFEQTLFSWEWQGDRTRNKFLIGSFAWQDEFIGMLICVGFVSWYLSLVFLFNRYLLRRFDWDSEGGYGPVISLVFGAALVAFISILSFVIEGAFQSGSFGASVASFFNWYTMSFESSLNLNFFVFVFVFVIQAAFITIYAVLRASDDLLLVAVETPERVLIERLPAKKNTLPVGESIDEIFGELPVRPPGSEDAN